jgi:drug/metabolite transporter (DMT)-like permease
MPNQEKDRLTAYLKLTAASVIWGISFIATKVAVGESPPAVIVWLRFSMAVIILFFFLRLRGKLVIPPLKELIYLALLGFLGVSLHQWLQSTGLVTAQASTTSWLVSTSPIFMALLAWVFLNERITPSSLAGILLASLGVLLVVSHGNLFIIFNSGFGNIGNILVLLSALNWAVFSVLSRRALEKYAAIYVLFYAMFFGVFFSSLHFLSIQGWIYINQLSSTAWLAVTFLGIGCSFLAYNFWYDGMQAIGATQAGAFLYIEPLVSLVVAAIALNETITLPALLGGSLILMGVWLVNRM